MKTTTNKNDGTDIIRELRLAYAMELETVQNYIANSVELDGVRSEVVKKELESDVATEVGHAQQLAHRIHTLGGRVPGSLELTRTQTFLQPPKDRTNVVSVIKGVIQAEQNAITHYRRIIDLCEKRDYVTQELVIQILGNEEEHHREFSGFLKEYQS
jgi:bacterioferritin